MQPLLQEEIKNNLNNLENKTKMNLMSKKQKNSEEGDSRNCESYIKLKKTMKEEEKEFPYLFLLILIGVLATARNQQKRQTTNKRIHKITNIPRIKYMYICC